MTKLTSLTAFFFLLCFSCIVSHCLSRPITAAGKFGEEYWFKHPWLFAHAPMPNGGFKWPVPEKQWPYAHGPIPDEGWKWHSHWHLAHSPFPCPWWPKKEVAADEIEEPAAVAAPPLAV